MSLEWSLFVPGALLLLLPADRLLSSRVQLRTFGSFQSLENSPRFRPWWWVPALWLDPLRGFLGTWLLVRACGVDLTDPRLAVEQGYWLMVGVLTLGIGCQTTTRRNEETILAPMAYVAGLVFAVGPWTVALVAVVMAVLGMLALRAYHAFFTVGALALTLLGLLMGVKLARLVPGAAAFALPMVIGLVWGRVLMLPARDNSGRTGF